MKAFITSIYAITCIAFIGFSYNYWTERTSVSQASGLIKENKTETSSDQDRTQLLTMANNWPEQSVERFKQALDEERPFKIIIAGSPALGGESGWAQAVKMSLLDSFGSGNVSVEIKEYDMTSREFIEENKHLELASLKGDLILLEPFLLKNNGFVSISDTLDDLSATIDAVKQTAPDTAILLQPSYPLYQARIYPNQVNQLKGYAEEKGIIYLDHWQSWPDANTDEIKTLLTEDQSGPNEQGHKLWSAYITDYLINE